MVVNQGPNETHVSSNLEKLREWGGTRSERFSATWISVGTTLLAVAPFFGPLYFFRLFPLSFPLAVLGVMLTVLGLLTAGASDKRRQIESREKDFLWQEKVADLTTALERSESEQEESKTKHIERERFWEDYLFESMKSSMEDLNWITADLVRASGIRSEAELMASRKIILEMMRHSLGPASGVRTNVFEIDVKSETMVANPNLTFGREDRCSLRRFTSADTTYRMALQGLTRFEPNISLDKEMSGEELAYETFIAAPIGTGNSLYGIVSVDAPHAGDLTELDRAVFIHLAQLFSLT